MSTSMEGMTMGNVLRRVAKRYATQEALIFEGERYTFAQFDARVNQLANGLRALGIAREDKVAIFSRNCNEYLETYFACARLGAVAVTLNFRLAPGEIEYMVNQSDSKILIVEACFQDFFVAFLDKININKETILVIDGEPTITGGLAYEEFIARYQQDEPGIEVDPDDPVLLLYTSGTTGLPKGTLLTQANNIWDALAYIYHCEPRCGDKLLQGMPFIHVSGIHIFTCANIYKGLPTVIQRVWNPREAAELIARERCTYAIILVPMLQTLIDLPDLDRYDFSSLRFVMSAAAKYTNEMIIKAMYKLGLDSFYFGYGLSEAAPMVSLTETTGETLEKENCIGWPAWHVDVKVVNAAGEAGPDEVGELLVKGPNVFQGYYKNEEATAQTLDGGWLHTGDLVKYDEDGCLFFVDRSKDMIKSGGENVYAVEVEMALLKSNPELAEAVVVGIADPKWGEAVKAFVVLKQGKTSTPEQIVANTRPNLAGFKLPKYIEFIDEIPRSSSGKVQKYVLRQREAK